MCITNVSLIKFTAGNVISFDFRAYPLNLMTSNPAKVWPNGIVPYTIDSLVGR